MIQEKDLYSVLQNKVKKVNLSNQCVKLIEVKKLNNNNKVTKKTFPFMIIIVLNFTKRKTKYKLSKNILKIFVL